METDLGPKFRGPCRSIATPFAAVTDATTIRSTTFTRGLRGFLERLATAPGAGA
jgi:hypothetical protein